MKKIPAPRKAPVMADLRIYVDYDDPVVAELIRSSLSRYIPRLKQTHATDASLQWCSYESISFDDILKNHRNLCNSYIFRKALIRKHFLANTVQCWLSKHRESILTKSVPKTYLLECDYSEYLDEALNERFELRGALEVNETRVPDKRQHFILKPSMTDRGQGIRIFSTYEELQEIFEEFDNYEEIEEDENDGLVASQLRHFVVQEYISRPLLLDTIRPGKKFHIRAYVVAFGAIKVWVWSEMLALFAAETYSSPTVAPDEMARHLTNTCLQDGPAKDENVLQFWSLPLSNDVLRLIFRQICQITGEIFLAAAAGQQMHFQTIPNVFEIFGVDFIIDEDHQVYLLEINSFPDFRQTGKRLTDHVVGGLFDEVTRCIICPFFGIAADEPIDEIDPTTGWKRGHLALVQQTELRGSW